MRIANEIRSFACLALVVASLTLGAAWAQDILTGEAHGDVRDINNDVRIEGAAMTLTNVDKGWEKKALSDDSGNYVFIQLEPGNYKVQAAKDGYKSSEILDFLIPLNRPKLVLPPFRLRKDDQTPTATLTVTSEGVSRVFLVNAVTRATLATLSEPGQPGTPRSTTDWTLRSNFDAALIHVLPLRDMRTFDQLALFSPGVFRAPFSSGSGPAVGIGVGAPGQFSVNGLRSRSNNFTVDGSDNNDADIGVRRQGFLSPVPQTIESVQDFQIVTAGASAESGRNAGSMVNAVSRGGQEKTHGTLYGFFSPNAMRARNYFDRSFTDTVNVGSHNGGSFSGKDDSSGQVGGVIGGTLLPKKAFYFTSLEVQRVRGTTLRHFVVPTAGERGLRIRNNFVPVDQLGDFFLLRGVPYSDITGKGVFSLYPLPNNPSGPFGANTYSEVESHDANGAIFSEKVDWQLSSRHTATGRYNLTDDRALLPFTSEAIHSSIGTKTRTQNLSLFLNSNLGNFGSVFRVSYGRTRLAFPADKGSPLLFGSDASNRPPGLSPQPIDTAYGHFGPFGSTGPIGQLTIQPYSTVGIDVFNFPQGRVDNTYQVGDSLTWVRKRHTLKAGFDFHRSQLNSFADRNSRPLVIFDYGTVGSTCMLNPTCPFATADGVLRGTDLAALGAPAGYLQTISTAPVPDSTIGLRISRMDLFVDESRKIRSNLVLNLGLRYELQTVAKEANGRIERGFDLQPGQFGHLQPSGSSQVQQIINSANLAFDRALAGWENFLAGRKKIHDPDWKNFAPRIGIAWTPEGEGTTVVRAGFGLFYDATLGAVTSQSRNVFPTFVPVNFDLSFRPPTGQLLNNPVFFSFVPTGTPVIRPGTLNSYNLSGDAFATGLGTLFMQSLPSPTGSLSSNGLAFTLPEKDWKTSYAEQWLLSVDRDFGGRLFVSVSYVGTRGLHLPRFATPNAGLISSPVLQSSPASPLAIVDTPPRLDPQATGRPQSGLGAYTVLQDAASSSYHALQLSVERRLKRGLEVRGHWTWSHSIDDVSDPFEGRGFFALPENSRISSERASSNFDARHRVAGYAIWHTGGLVKKALTTVAATTEFQTGQPFTVNSAVDQNRDGNLTDRVNAGRNGSRAPRFASVDMALERKIALAGENSLIVRMEAFNLLNWTSRGIPVRILESPGFGKPFDTQLNARSVRLALKVAF